MAREEFPDVSLVAWQSGMADAIPTGEITWDCSSDGYMLMGAGDTFRSTVERPSASL